eukprot:1157275-Pelagomonas_calceolata.AAC.3
MQEGGWVTNVITASVLQCTHSTYRSCLRLSSWSIGAEQPSSLQVLSDLAHTQVAVAAIAVEVQACLCNPRRGNAPLEGVREVDARMSWMRERALPRSLLPGVRGGKPSTLKLRSAKRCLPLPKPFRFSSPMT